MITKFARLEFELFTRPSKSDFLRVHQYLICQSSNRRYDLVGQHVMLKYGMDIMFSPVYLKFMISQQFDTDKIAYYKKRKLGFVLKASLFVN